MINPQVSIIMPIYNSEKYLADAVKSVIAQTYSFWELILIDDNSSDGSKKNAEHFKSAEPRIKLICLNTNSGAAVARNAGILMATGKYIAFLDADDLWLPEKLEHQVHFMENSGIALSCTWYKAIAHDGNELNKIIKSQPNISYKQLLKSNTIGCLTAMYNVEVCGIQLMPLIRKRQDYGLWLNILKSGHQAACIPQVLAVYRTGANSLSNNKFSVLKYNWQLLRKHQGLSFFESLYYFCCNLLNKIFKYLH